MTNQTLTDAQITAVFEGMLDYSPRAADLAILKMMGASVANVAEYIWDHYLGEPDEPSLEHIRSTIDSWLMELGG